MSDSTMQADPLLRLAEAICDETASEQDFAQLDVIMLADPDARRRYLDYCQLHFALRLQLRAQVAGQRVRHQMNVESVSPTSDNVCDEGKGDSSALPLTFLGSTVHGDVGYFSSGWPVAYLVATVILGIGLLVGLIVHVPNPSPIASNPASLIRPTVDPKIAFVGRITGMVDCQWSDPQTAVPGPVAVPLGRKYSLASGLMEITYDTGAKVILQGPCTYEVESPAGGYLSLGKLTARVEKKEERRTKNKELPDSRSSFLIPHSYFAVRTPIATVTDLGTEFGVEVDKDGRSEVLVIEGVVNLAAMENGSPIGPPRGLVAGQIARVSPRDPASSSHAIEILAEPANPKKFVRTMSASALPGGVSYAWRIGLAGEFATAEDDLIGVGQATLSSVELTSGKALYGSDVRKLNDGDAYEGRTDDETIEQVFCPLHGEVVPFSPNSGLIGYWKMDEVGGASVADSSGNGLNGTASGTTIVAGMVGNAREFSASSDYVDVGQVFGNLGSGPFTISLWAQETGALTPPMTLFGQMPSGAHRPAIIIQRDYRPGNSTGAIDRIVFTARDAAGSDEFYLGQMEGQGTPLGWRDDAKWRHVVMGRDATTTYAYVDGVLAGSMASTVLPNLTGLKANIGNGPATHAEAFLGKLDEVRIYDTWIGDGGVAALYAGTGIDRRDKAFIPSDGAIVTVALNTDLHPRGYEVASIISLTGGNGRIAGQDRSSQKYDVAYSVVVEPDTFIVLRRDTNATVDRSAHGYQELQVTLSSGRKEVPIASGVAKLRFTFHNTASRDPESVYREIDVVGTPTSDSPVLQKNH